MSVPPGTSSKQQTTDLRPYRAAVDGSRRRNKDRRPRSVQSRISRRRAGLERTGLAVLWALVAVFLLQEISSAAEKFTLRGTVRDASSGDTVTAATVRIVGSRLGTVTNTHGQFLLTLEEGQYRILVSSVGYSPDTLTLALSEERTLEVALQPAEILLPEVLATSEDPAYEIIRRAIAAKRTWMARLLTYSFEAFTRQVLSRDTAIASITESYTRGYWAQGDTLREVVRTRRQTENIPEQSNFASVGRILNFNEDRLRFVGFSFVGPTAIDALDYYDYQLLRTLSAQGNDVYEIRMTPRTRTTPLFSGTVRIADNSYALVGVEVEPNEAFSIPFVREAHLHYRQAFDRYDETFWLPVDIRIDARFAIGIPGISFPPIAFTQTSVIYDYAINVALPDSLMQGPRLRVDSMAMKTDTTLWSQMQVLPLNPAEEEAYSAIDSTQTLQVQFRPGGLAATLGSDEGVLGSALGILDVGYNRVEGFRTGVMRDDIEILPIAVLKGGIAYSWSAKLTTFVFGTTLYTSSAKRFGLGAEIYRRVDHRPDQGYYAPIANSVAAVTAKLDYPDYFRSDGWRGFFLMHPVDVVRAELSYTAEDHRSLELRSDFSLFGGSAPFRPNPLVDEGLARSVGISLYLGAEPVPLGLLWRNSLQVNVEHSSSSFLASAFDFTRYEAVASYALPTFGGDLLFPATLYARVSAGTASGSLPAQRVFDLESRFAGLGPFGVLRGGRVKEFSGTSYAALILEHNFRSIPFLALGIPFLYESGIEFILHGALAQTWTDGPTPYPATGGWYSEVGVGLSRIFEVLRTDLTWRLKEPRLVAFTLGFATVF
jgi:hypothetical protein